MVLGAFKKSRGISYGIPSREQGTNLHNKIVKEELEKKKKKANKKESEATKRNKEKLKAGKYKNTREKMELENRIKIGDAAITDRKKKHKKSQKDRERMNRLRKEKPEAYKRIKKRRAKKELESQYKRTKSGKYVKKRINSSEWD